MKLVVDSFYAMFTPRQVQKALGCSRATLYRTLKRAGVKLYFIPNHPGAKYIWGISLYKLLETPAAKKLIKKHRNKGEFPNSNIKNISARLGLPLECDER